MNKEKIFDIQDSGVGFELTEDQLKQTGEKQHQILFVHGGNGKVKEINVSVVTPEDVAETLGMYPDTIAWYKKRGFDPFSK